MKTGCGGVAAAGQATMLLLKFAGHLECSTIRKLLRGATVAVIQPERFGRDVHDIVGAHDRRRTAVRTLIRRKRAVDVRCAVAGTEHLQVAIVQAPSLLERRAITRVEDSEVTGSGVKLERVRVPGGVVPLSGHMHLVVDAFQHCQGGVRIPGVVDDLQQADTALHEAVLTTILVDEISRDGGYRGIVGLARTVLQGTLDVQREILPVDSVISLVADAITAGIELVAHVDVPDVHSLGDTIHRRTIDREGLDSAAWAAEEFLADGEAAGQGKPCDGAIIADATWLGSRYAVSFIIERLVVAAVRRSVKAMLHPGGIGIIAGDDIAVVDPEGGNRRRAVWQRDGNVGRRLTLSQRRQNETGCRQQ